MRKVGKADIEFYYGGMVLSAARAMTARDWNTLSVRSRQRLLDRGVAVVSALVNDRSALQAMFIRFRAVSAESLTGGSA